jgi:hypothetical protein
MNNAETGIPPASTRRLGAERRVASAVLTNYIHERSSRHGRASERDAVVTGPPQAREADRPAGGCWG